MREYWQMTRSEIHSGRYEVRNTMTGETGSDSGEHVLNLEIAHRAAIKRALRNGLDVPQSVLADYPDLEYGEPPRKGSK